MRRLLGVLVCFAALAGCATVRHAPHPFGAPAPWDERLTQLERAEVWQLDGRAAAALGQQGWQASLTWRQNGSSSDLHLAGPLGVGATEIRLTPDHTAQQVGQLQHRPVAEDRVNPLQRRECHRTHARCPFPT
jgi:outer membrane biogenesis lipoprotein LolB